MYLLIHARNIRSVVTCICFLGDGMVVMVMVIVVVVLVVVKMVCNLSYGCLAAFVLSIALLILCYMDRCVVRLPFMPHPSTS